MHCLSSTFFQFSSGHWCRKFMIISFLYGCLSFNLRCVLYATLQAEPAAQRTLEWIWIAWSGVHSRRNLIIEWKAALRLQNAFVQMRFLRFLSYCSLNASFQMTACRNVESFFSRGEKALRLRWIAALVSVLGVLRECAILDFPLDTPYSAGHGKLLQVSAVVDKPARRAASRRTCCKQVRWTLSVINLRPS